MADPLAVAEVTSDTPLVLTAAGAHEPMLATVFSGTCLVDRKTRPLLGGRHPVRLGFYVPQAGPIRASHLLECWVEMSLSWVEHISNNRGARERYGVHDPQVQLVNDERGSGSLWPYVSFTAMGGTAMQLRFRVTVLRPHDAS